MARARIKDVAEVVGVSAAAASFALNGKPGVSEPVRRRVLAAADEFGWRANAAASSLAAARAGALGLVVARRAASFGREAFFNQLLAGIAQTARAGSSSLVLEVADTVEEECETYERWYREHRVDGVLVVDHRKDDPRPALLTSLGMPAVLVGGPPGAGLPLVSISDGLAMAAVIDHLADAGCQRLAYVCGIAELAHSERRAAVFVEHATSRGVAAAPVLFTDYSAEAGDAATRAVLARSPRPDAIVYDNEILTLAAP